MSDEKKNQAPESGAERTPNEEALQDGATQNVDDDNKRLLIMRNPVMGIKSGYILRQVGQAYMVMPTGPRMKEYEGMITLNETGAFLFKEMQKPDPTQEKLVQACIAEYDATPEEANQAVLSFMQQCVACGIMDYKDRIFMADGREITEDDLRKPAPQ